MLMKAVGPGENANPEVEQTVVWRGGNGFYSVAKVLRQIGASRYLVKDCADGSENEIYDVEIIAKEVHEEVEKAVSPQARMNELSVDLRLRKERAQEAFLLESEDPTEHIRIFSDFDTWLANEAAKGCGEADELLGLRQQVEQERTANTNGQEHFHSLEDRAKAAAKLAVTAKCLVHGCENRSDQGVFRNDLCLSCHTAITTGRAGHGNGFIGELQRDNEKLVRAGRELHIEAVLRREFRCRTQVDVRFDAPTHDSALCDLLASLKPGTRISVRVVENTK